MATPSTSIEQLITLNQIAETLNRSADVHSALNSALARLVELMGLETGWVFLHDSTAQDRWAGQGYRLVAYHNLPPALSPDKAEAWATGCDCQGLCNKGQLQGAYNEVRCSRLAGANGDGRGLAVHASAPLRVDDRTLGILNVAGADWNCFSESTLALLTNIGSQMGAALERARLFDLLQERHILEQASLLDLSNQLLSRLDLDDLITYLVEEVRKLLRADACALLLPDRAGDWLTFRAASGWRADPVTNQRQIPNDRRTPAGQVMHSQQTSQVEDLEKVEGSSAWRPDWLHTEGFRGHTAAALVAEGRSVGVIVIDMRRPRLLDEHELRFLHLMANQAAIAIEKVRLHREEIKQQRLEEELTVAHKIQRNLLPGACPVVDGWGFAAIYQAAQQVGGDFYDYFELPGQPGRWGFVIADAVGKGIPAALLMAVSRTIIRATALSTPNPAEAVQQANKLILKDSYAQRFVSAFYAELDTRRGRLLYTNAGHNRPLWWQAASGEVHELATQGTVLGVFEESRFGQAEIELAPGDVLLLYTDGVTETMNTERQMFGEDRLRATIAANPEANAAQLLHTIIEAIQTFTGHVAQSDDLTLFVIKRCF